MSEQNFATVVFPIGGRGIQVQLDNPDNTVWVTAADMAQLFECSVQNVDQHVKSIYREGELDEVGTSKNFLIVRQEGVKSVQRSINHYNLDVIISVGYRINSKIAVRFRRWATERLKEFIIKGYSVNEERLRNDPVALEALAAKIRSIRRSERLMYEKVKEVFKESSSDYDPGSQHARSFFAMAQDKFHYAVTGKTAAELILERADHTKPYMGLANFEGKAPNLSDARIGKNYLLADELRAYENISEQFMLFAESKAMRGQKMTMEELSFKLNTLLTANDYPVLYQYDKYKRGAADKFANQELAKYKTKLALKREDARLASSREQSSKTHSLRSGRERKEDPDL